MSQETKALYISISGTIGAGKSTLSKSLAEELGVPVYHEPVDDNEYLADFYDNPKDHAFALQVFLLNKRFAQHQQIIWSKKGGVSDRTLHEDCIFARILHATKYISDRDYRTYLSLFDNMQSFMRQPSVIVHLDVTPEIALERIKKRGRECEANISIAYLRGLHSGYETFLQDISRTIPVIRINWTEFQSAKEVSKKIVDELQTMHNLRRIE